MAQGRYGNADKMNFEAPLTSLVWLTSIVSVVMTFIVSKMLIPNLGGHDDLWWKLSLVITCGTAAGAIIPEVVKVFTSTESAHVREVVTSSQEGGASLNVLSGLVAGNFSGYWMGIVIVALMGGAYLISGLGLAHLMIAAPVFAFGLVAFGFLGMGPVTIAVDSYGPVTDNAQSVYELSLIETIPDIKAEIKKDFGFEPDFEKGKHFLEENDGAGNTFKATAKPVLIGTAVDIRRHHHDLLHHHGAHQRAHHRPRPPLHAARALPPRPHHRRRGHLLVHRRLHAGGGNRLLPRGPSSSRPTSRLDGAEKASIEDSKKVVEICTQYAQKGMINIFLEGVPLHPLAFACLDEYFFIGYLISIAIFGLYQAIFMANAGGAWDNAKKLVEVEMKQKGTPRHAACVVGDTVGDPFKDTSSVAMNPIIKFTTLFGLLAVELAIDKGVAAYRIPLAAIFFLLSTVFVYRSFYGMRIKTDEVKVKAKPVESCRFSMGRPSRYPRRGRRLFTYDSSPSSRSPGRGARRFVGVPTGAGGVWRRGSLHYSGGMRALCPACGLHHEVVRVLDDGRGEDRRDVYQVAPLAECTTTWLTDREILEARARFDVEPILSDEDDE